MTNIVAKAGVIQSNTIAVVHDNIIILNNKSNMRESRRKEETLIHFTSFHSMKTNYGPVVIVSVGRLLLGKIVKYDIIYTMIL